ncbi:MAG: MFS transporter [Saprospiraceae bacterium]|nr:MFS transporter [Saprospiraceae bacterium]
MFFYSAGVQTVIYLATVFASKELGFESTELIIIVLLLQLVAIVGAYLFSLLGNVKRKSSFHNDNVGDMDRHLYWRILHPI